MTRRCRWLACAWGLLPALVSAQTLSGAVALNVARGTYASDGAPSASSSFWQDYSLGYSSTIWDPRLLKYTAEVSFRTNSLQVGDSSLPQQGRQRDVGYKLGASLFPTRPFPLSVQASKDTLDETGDYQASGGIRGGIAFPPGESLPTFRTRNSDLGVGWQLGLPGLPRIDLGYRKNRSVATGGPYRAEQRGDDLHVAAAHDTAQTRQTLRYQRTTFENLFSQAFDQRLSDLDYEFAAPLSRHSRTSVRVGRRTSFSLFDNPTARVEDGDSAYQPPSRGQVSTAYLVSSFAYDPATRMLVEVTANLDRQDAALVRTGARLASATLRYDVLPGLSLNAIGTMGDRGQAIDRDTMRVFTRTGQVGASYHARVGWLDGGLHYTSGLGANTTVDGRGGASRSWAGQASLAASGRWFTLGGGYDRAISTDSILAYGNVDLERWRSTLQGQTGRFALNGSYEQSLVARGVDLTYARTRQRMFSGTASLRLGRGALLSANAGGFQSDTWQSRDRNIFAGVSIESQLGRGLHVAAWARRGQMAATQAGLSQQSLTGFAQLEYGRRLLACALEYRYNDQDLRTGHLLDAVRFRGHQMAMRVTRKFGLRF